MKVYTSDDDSDYDGEVDTTDYETDKSDDRNSKFKTNTKKRKCVTQTNKTIEVEKRETCQSKKAKNNERHDEKDIKKSEIKNPEVLKHPEKEKQIKVNEGDASFEYPVSGIPGIPIIGPVMPSESLPFSVYFNTPVNVLINATSGGYLATFMNPFWPT